MVVFIARVIGEAANFAWVNSSTRRAESGEKNRSE